MTMKPDEMQRRILALEKRINLHEVVNRTFVNETINIQNDLIKRITALEKKNGTKPVATRTK